MKTKCVLRLARSFQPSSDFEAVPHHLGQPRVFARHVHADEVAERRLQAVVQLTRNAVLEYVGQQPMVGEVQHDLEPVGRLRLRVERSKRELNHRGTETQRGQKGDKSGVSSHGNFSVSLCLCGSILRP